MYSKLVTIFTLVAATQAGLLPTPIKYSPASIVSSQSIVRHDQPQPATKVPVSSPLSKHEPDAYYAAPVEYSSAPIISTQNIVHYDQPQRAAKITVSAPVNYHEDHEDYQEPLPGYSSAAAVSTQNIVRHDEPKPVAKVAITAPVTYHDTPAVYNTGFSQYYSGADASSQNILSHEQSQHASKVTDATLINKIAVPAPVHEAPEYYNGAIVSSQKTAPRDELQSVAKITVTAPVAKTGTPTPFAYHNAPVVYQTAVPHYSPAADVSSQNIVRHDQPRPVSKIAVTAPIDKVGITAPVIYHDASIAYHAAVPQYSASAIVSSQNLVRHDEHQHIDKVAIATTPIAKIGLTAPVTYHEAPIVYQTALPKYSSAGDVSSQNIVRHDQLQFVTKNTVAGPVNKIAVDTPITYQTAPAAVTFHSASEHHSSQNIESYDQPPKQVAIVAPTTIVAHSAPANDNAASTQDTHAVRTEVAVPAVGSKYTEDFYAHPKYEFSYSVADTHTGDIKSQQESRDGDVVKGSYSLHEANGSIRTVKYYADDHSGFSAAVHNTEPTAASAHEKVAQITPDAYYHH